MKTQIISTLERYFLSQIDKHRLNIQIMINNPTAIPEHTDFADAVEKEIAVIAEFEDKLEVIKKYFKE